MVDVTVKCDKPYDLDRADKAKGKSRRRRKDSHTTAYELTIRLSKEQRELMADKKKYVRVVYARNKKEDLAAQMKEFEREISAKLRDAAQAAGARVRGDDETVSAIIRLYLKSREEVTSPGYAKDGLDLTIRYIDPTIGSIPFRELTITQIEEGLDAIPEISRKLNEAKREREIAGRAERRAKQKRGEAKSYKYYPKFRPVRVAGKPTQHRVLSLIKLAGNYAVDKGLLEFNVANSKRLSTQYPKNKPLLDNFTVEEAKYVFEKIQELPLSSRKVELHLLLMCGLRPCELLSLTFADIDTNQEVLRVVRRLKTGNAARAIPLTPVTMELMNEWRQSRIRFAREIGVKFSDSWFVCREDGQKPVYNTLKQRWQYFLKSIEMDHRRPYSLRHSFATLYLLAGGDARSGATVSGHASAGFFVNTYAGYLPTAAQTVMSRYARLLSELDDNEEELTVTRAL